MTTRVLTWNIQRGGGTRTQHILDVITNLDADIVVLTEYQTTRTRTDFADTLSAAGWPHLLRRVQVPKENSTLLASRLPFEVGELGGHPHCEHRWLHARFAALDLDVFGVYFHGVAPKTPRSENRAERVELTDTLIDRLERLKARPALAIGDLNTGGLLDSTHDYFTRGTFARMLVPGWVDAYRHLNGERREYSWWNHTGNGFLLDHALATASLQPRLMSVELVDQVGPIALHKYPDRPAGAPIASDHAALLVELSSPEPA